MAVGTGLKNFAQLFPERFFDVGISEEHAVIFAAGLAAEGYVPFLTLYSTFSQRVVDYIIHDVCLQNLPVILCLDRAGIVGDDGPTHHGVFDIPLFRSIPNLIMAQPHDEAELFAMLHSAPQWGGPAVIRYPRGSGPGAALPETPAHIIPGQAEVLASGGPVQIWTLGDMAPMAWDVVARLESDGVAAGVVNTRFIRPLDTELLELHRRDARVIVTLENSLLAGGFGSAVGEWLADHAFTGRLLRFGWPDRFIPHGTAEMLHARNDFTAESVVAAVRAAVAAFDIQETR